MKKLDYIEFSDGTKHTFEEISNVLGIPVCNVKCRYYASKARLEDCYYGRRMVNSRTKQKYNYHGEQLYLSELRVKLKCDFTRLRKAIDSGNLESLIEECDNRNSKKSEHIILNGIRIDYDYLYDKYGYELAKYRIEELGLKDAYLSLKYDIKPKEFKYALFTDNGEVVYTLEDAVKRLNRTKRYIAIFVRDNGIEKYHEIMQSNIEIKDNERIITKAVDSLNINGDIYSSHSSLAIFLNIALSTLSDAINRGRLKNLLEVSRYDERILFKNNSPYSTWFANGIWIYECPVCKRKLLMSTEELINYKHDDRLCIEFEIE